MTKSQYLAERLREVFLDGRWIANTNYRDQLENLTLEQATNQIEGLNSIALLTFHINYYLEGLLHAFKTGKLEISDKYSFNLEPFSTEPDWKKLVNDVLLNAEAFSRAVSQLEESTLHQPFIDEKYGSYLRNIEGVIEHSYYHLGQIVLLRKIHNIGVAEPVKSSDL